MALKNTEAGGYDCDWVSEPPHYLKCQICLCVAREPHQHPGDERNECGKIFCLGCIKKLPKKECPNCRGALNTFKDVNNSRRIKELIVKCKNLDNGCSWTGELGSLDDHLRECGYALLPCPNECQEREEVRRFLRKDLNNHKQNECPRREHECSHCKQTGEYSERVSTHLDTCPEVKVKCPNASCTIQVARCKVTDHRAVCGYESMPCKYEEVGCQERPLRMHLEAHENEAQKHLKVTTEQVLSMKKTLNEQQKTMLALQNSVTEIAEQLKKDFRIEVQPAVIEKQRNGILVGISLLPMKFEVKNFQQLKDSGDEFYSPAFYTSKAGYKMRIQVYPDGNGKGKGTHVSVYAAIMKGVNDDHLTWPFLGRVKFKLVNQLEDKNHHIHTCHFDKDECTYNKRVTKGDGGNVGWGYHKFKSHADLGYKPENNCQYLKDDTLVFKIEVEEP